MKFLVLSFAFVLTFASSHSIEPLIKGKNGPKSESEFKIAGFKKIQNGRIERNSDIYSADSWVKDISPWSLHVECAPIFGYFCETRNRKNPGVAKAGLPYVYKVGENRYLIVAGRGRETDEEFISVLTPDFKELCAKHFTKSYDENVSRFLKNPSRYLKWTNSSCEFVYSSKAEQF